MAVLYLIADGLSDTQRADIESRLRQRSVAVWAEFARLPPDLERAARKVALRHSAGVLIWGGGCRDAELREMLQDAREARCRLVAVAPNARLIRMAPEAVVLEGEDTSALIDSICAALAGHADEADWSGAAADFARSVGDRVSLQLHLRRFSASPFAPLAAAELRRKSTQKFRFSGAYAADVDWSAEDVRGAAHSRQVWRASALAFNDRAKRLTDLLVQQWHLHRRRIVSSSPYLAAGAIAALVSVPLQQMHAAVTELPGPARAVVAEPRVEQADADAHVDLAPAVEPAPRNSRESAAGSAAQTAPLAIALSPVMEAPPAAESATLSGLQAVSRVPDEALQLAAAAAEPMRAPFDLTTIEPAARRAVERARRDEQRGIAAALQARTSHEAGRSLSRQIHNGALYDGRAVNSVPDGLGRAMWPNRDRYAGNWRDGRPHGFGIYRFADGRVYEGVFANGAPTGDGAFWDADGRAMTGEVLFNALLTTAAEIDS